MHRLRLFGLAAVLAAFAACASSPKPESQIASSEGAIRGASEAGAKNVPQATLHLRLAQEQRATALQLIANGENGRAKYVLERSEADAELALALAREANAKAEAGEASEKVQDLQQKVQP